MKLSVALATHNEEQNIERCLKSIEDWVDEIIIVDGASSDNTVKLAKLHKAKVVETDNPPIFHINKQKALDACHGKWILQLDADEIVTQELAQEIRDVVFMSDESRVKKEIDPKKEKLFIRHQNLLEKRDGLYGTLQGEISAYFIPRRNYFLGKLMKYSGLYPDGVIRLVKRGKAWFPQKSVHEQIQVKGRVSWLNNDLIHMSNSTLARYWKGAHTYTNLLAQELKAENEKASLRSLVEFIVMRPIVTFFTLFVRHKGFLDGIYGFLFALFSSLHYPTAYYKYFRISK